MRALERKAMNVMGAHLTKAMGSVNGLRERIQGVVIPNDLGAIEDLTLIKAELDNVRQWLDALQKED